MSRIVIKVRCILPCMQWSRHTGDTICRKRKTNAATAITLAHTHGNIFFMANLMPLCMSGCARCVQSNTLLAYTNIHTHTQRKHPVSACPRLVRSINKFDNNNKIPWNSKKHISCVWYRCLCEAHTHTHATHNTCDDDDGDDNVNVNGDVKWKWNPNLSCSVNT